MNPKLGKTQIIHNKLSDDRQPSLSLAAFFTITWTTFKIRYDENKTSLLNKIQEKMKLLSITIPTYNRCNFLIENLERLLHQLTDDVEIIVLDNCSTDGTAEYCKSNLDKISYIKNSTNIGGDGNIVECLKKASGEYIWILCDDDLPASNAVDSILGFLNTGQRPGLLSLRTQWCGKNMEGYNPAPIYTEWEIYDRDMFLEQAVDILTFCSAIVVKRDAIELDFIQEYIKYNLSPAAIALQAAGKSNSVAMPCKKILFGRSGNAGGYDAYTVFSKNICELFSDAERYGFSRVSLTSVYRSVLSGVMLYVISAFPKTLTGCINLLKFSYKYKEFYTKIIPKVLISIYKNNISFRFSFSSWKKYKHKIENADIYEMQNYLDKKTNKMWYKIMFYGIPNGSVKYPFRVNGEKYIKINSNFHAGPGLRLEAWASYGGDKYNPEIIIGSDVCLNSNVHIGAINSIVIGNGVLVGSNVLITDHTHGRSSLVDVSIPPLKRKLFSKGPVIIEDDVLIGENVSILPGVRIGRASIIGAGAVVTKDIPPFSIAKGVPATSTSLKC